jgi:PKD repeat protein
MANVTRTTATNDQAIADIDRDYGWSWWRISPKWVLPAITKPVVIDGYTQGRGTSQAAHPNADDGFGWSNDPILRIELDGSQVVQNVPPDNIAAGLRPGLILAGGSSTVRGLVINRFVGGSGVGIEVTGTGENTIQGNFIGTDVSGKRVAGNPPATNLDPAAMWTGINVEGTSRHNLIGTNEDGVNDRYEANVVCGAGAGVGLRGPEAENVQVGGYNVVAGNTIGPGLNGALTYLDNGATRFLGNALGVGTLLFAHHDEIRGNLISGNIVTGIALGGGGNQLAAEYRGTITGNTITHNAHAGIIVAIKSQDCTITANEIAFNGTLGDRQIDNAPGVWIFDLLGRGIPTDISVLGNAIHDNTGLGIDLGGTAPPPPYGLDTPGINPDGVTLNDSAGHIGPNHYQNFPVLTSVAQEGYRLTFRGTLTGDPNTTFRLDFFANSSLFSAGNRTDPSGYGEGGEFLGYAEVTTDASGGVAFAATVDIPRYTYPGDFSATATNMATGDTSEFSRTIILPAAGPGAGPSVPPFYSDYTVVEGQSLTLGAEVLRNPENRPLSYSWDLNFDGVFGDADGMNPTVTWSQLVNLGLSDGLSDYGPNTPPGNSYSLVQVRVTDDRGDVFAPGIVTLGLPRRVWVLNAPPTATVTGPTAAVAGQPLTFTLTATDPSPVDQAAGFTYAIDWDGDGTVDQTITGPGEVQVTHTYSAAGTFTVRVTATDKDGGTSTPATVAVTVLPRQVTVSSDAAGGDVTLAAPAGTGLANAAAVPNPSPADAPAGVQFPLGFFTFQVRGVAPGGATTVTLSYPAGVTVNTYYQYGPTPDNPTPHWYEFLYDGTTGAVIDTASRTITLHFVDGRRGDHDLAANGVVVDPGTPALKPLRVQIDVRPEALNLASQGVIPVVLFGAADFDVTRVDLGTIRFAGAAVVQWSFADVNGDGRRDLVLHFRTQDTDLQQLYERLLIEDRDADGVLDSTRQTATVSLTGRTQTGVSFEGSDTLGLFLSGKALRDLLAQLFGG